MNEQETYLGIDLHTNSFTCCFINPDESRHKQMFSLDKESLQQFYEQLDSHTSVLLEATSNSFEFFDLLKDKVKNVIIGNTHKLKLISFVDQKTDKIDAEKLAKYLKMQIKGGEELISPVYVPEPVIRDLRSLFTTYQLLNKQIRSVKNRIHSILKQHLFPFFKERIFTDTKKEILKELPLPASSSFEIRLLLAEVNNLKEHKKQLEKQIKRIGAPYIHEIDILTSMSGISVFVALAVIADMADVHRFKNAKKFTSYLRSTPGVCSSNETEIQKKTSKSGRKLSVTLLTQSYVHFKKCNKRLRRWTDKHAGNKKSGVMRMAVLRNVLAEMYHMLKNNEYHWYRDEVLHARKMHEYRYFLQKEQLLPAA